MTRALLRLTSNSTVANELFASIELQLETVVLLFKQFIDDSDPTRAPDYAAGWLRVVALQHPNCFPTFPFSAEVIASIMQDWLNLLSPGLDISDSSLLLSQLERLASRLSHQPGAPIRALFIGDCLLWDTSVAVQINAHKYGYEVAPRLIAKRLGTELRTALRRTPGSEIDLVFYSPFSYGFSSAYAAFVSPYSAIRAKNGSEDDLIEAVRDVEDTLKTLVDQFDCPIYVHTVSGVTQVGPSWRGILAHLITRSRRQRAANLVNFLLSKSIEALRSRTGRSICRINEHEPLSHYSQLALGRVLFDAGEVHSTLLSHVLAVGQYTRACRAAGVIRSKKVVVCDLDNTLWDGLIGEGSVRHLHDRQAVLLSLKSKGVLLTISSKNDSTNVRFDGSSLSLADFVLAEINWLPKTMNIQRMATALNLPLSSFVFLDDRPDERALVSEELPDVLTLDSNALDTWSLLSDWSELLTTSSLKDRTSLYQDRFSRHAFLEAGSHEERGLPELYKTLELKLELREASLADMERVVELINRTNQFNTTAARITLAEIKCDNNPRRIVAAHASDRFGDMGIVGVLIVTKFDELEITHFVLSCRAFGFGIETAMLNSVLAAYPSESLRAKLIKTPKNSPCHCVFADNGFVQRGDYWRSEHSSSLANPSWLTITDRSNLDKNT